MKQVVFCIRYSAGAACLGTRVLTSPRCNIVFGLFFRSRLIEQIEVIENQTRSENVCNTQCWRSWNTSFLISRAPMSFQRTGLSGWLIIFSFLTAFAGEQHHHQKLEKCSEPCVWAPHVQPCPQQGLNAQLWQIDHVWSLLYGHHVFVGGCFHGTEQGEVPPADRAFQAAGLLDSRTGRAEPGENGGRQIHLLGSGCYFKHKLSPALNIDLDGRG